MLFLAPSRSHPEEEGCDDLLSAIPTSRANVLEVTYGSPGTNRLNTWEFEVETPARISLINVGDFTRSSASRPSESVHPPERIEVDTVLDSADLTTLEYELVNSLWRGEVPMSNPSSASIHSPIFSKPQSSIGRSDSSISLRGVSRWQDR